MLTANWGEFSEQNISSEAEIIIGGIGFRFIDTAGNRETTDTNEGLGIKRTFEKMEQSHVVVYLFDARDFNADGLYIQVEIGKIQKVQAGINANLSGDLLAIDIRQA